MSSVDGIVNEEIARLREELNKAKQRMQQWKEKTQAGVSEMRNRIVELTNQLEECRAANKLLSQQVSNATVSVVTPFAACDLEKSADSFSSFATFRVEQWLDDALTALCDTQLGKYNLLIEIANATSQELEKHKRRTAQTLRLQRKTTDALENEIANLREQVSVLQGDLAERSCAVKSRDQALEVLQGRLEEMEAAKVSYEAAQTALVSKLNAEQINVFEERLEEDRESMRREFAAREALIFDKHREEMEQLASRYEHDMAELRREIEEKPLGVVEIENGLALWPSNTARHPEDCDDVAYGELMSDLEALQEELRVSREENRKLTQEISALRTGPLSSGSLTALNSGSGTPESRVHPQKLTEAISRITELEEDVARLSEELYIARKRAVASVHQSSTVKNPKPSLVFEGQLAAYLRCTIVRLLCSAGEPAVAKNVFPVLNALLQFEKEDIEEVYRKNPDWIKRRF
uniref:Uncharacterized protein TCIL3000_4_260 n=1 Tax=Trypanosoma congolense (strain IL3000) TaxID=1068625 RepID=G0UKN9_TRYCI|nr:unnamed protein product [Trypanosoma congolense IL3000]